jgi:4'-phosphopantetheinyl transferase EntD
VELFRRFGDRLADGIEFLYAPIEDRIGDLHPTEISAVARAVDKRRREFSTGRWLAREGLRRLGLVPAAIPAAPDRTPCWPPGVVGSVSHSGALCAVAVAPARRFASIGLDLEMTPVPDKVASTVVSPHEPSEYRSPPLLGLVFSAKEAVFKCVFPLDGKPRGFHAVEISIDATARTFSATILDRETGRRDPVAGGGLFETDPSGVLTAFVITS